MEAAIPDATLAVAAGCGHAVHLEEPETAASLIAGWLAVDGAPAGGVFRALSAVGAREGTICPGGRGLSCPQRRGRA